MTSAELDVAAAKLVEAWGPDPQKVGAIDGTEDDWGDLLCQAAEALGIDPGAVDDEEWQHFQDVAYACRETTMRAWLGQVAAAC